MTTDDYPFSFSLPPSMAFPPFQALPIPTIKTRVCSLPIGSPKQMGNCLFGGFGDNGNNGGVIQVITSDGGILEFYPPITAKSIATEFPGHAIFPGDDLFWRPLSLQQELLPGQSYYLLPLNNAAKIGGQLVVREGHVRSKSIPMDAPYRMSFDCQVGILKRSYTEVFSRYHKNGFWKVKLVISPDQLLEILSQEARTQELIENVRAVAKCGNIGFSSSSSSSVGFSDQWSLSSSRIAISKQDCLMEI